MTKCDITPTNNETSRKIEAQLIAAIHKAIDERFAYLYEEAAHDYPYSIRYDGDSYTDRCVRESWEAAYEDIVKQADEACREDNDVLALFCKLAAYRYGNDTDQDKIAKEFA